MSAVRRRDLVWAVVMVVMMTAVWMARGDQADAGTPFGLGIDVVYVTVGSNFPDALGVGPGAGAANAPILIVPTDPPIPLATESELLRLDPRSVVIVGGDAVVSPAMESALTALLPAATISRISGANRYETNAMFSESIYPIEKWVAISAGSFVPEDPANDTVSNNGSYTSNSGSGGFFAQLDLPDGSEILEFRGEAFDDNTGAITFSLVKTDTTNKVVIASMSTVDSVFDQYLSDVVGDEIVDNELYAYYVRVTGAFGSDRYLHNARVKVRLGAP